MSYYANAQKLRTAMTAAGTMLTDEQALTVPGIYPVWSGDGVIYALNDRVQYDGVLYKCITAHTSQESWKPNLSPALWVRVSIEEYPEWIQPSGSTDAYQSGDKVTHGGKKWVSTIDNNVWEPGTVEYWKEEE